jgi:triosephosphate isomerase
MKPVIVANWKANNNLGQLERWLDQVKNNLADVDNVEIVVCPTFLILNKAKELIKGSNLKLGAQTVSSKPVGAYTGEIPAELLAEIVEYCIIGHSERRKYFSENSQQIVEKVELLLKNQVVPILCVSDLTQLDEYLSASQIFKENAGKIIFVYEPPNAISGGGDYHPESSDSVLRNTEEIRKKIGDEVVVLYGGSVNKEVIGNYVKESNINGVLVGKASLDPGEFTQITRVLASTVL